MKKVLTTFFSLLALSTFGSQFEMSIKVNNAIQEVEEEFGRFFQCTQGVPKSKCLDGLESHKELLRKFDLDEYGDISFAISKYYSGTFNDFGANTIVNLSYENPNIEGLEAELLKTRRAQEVTDKFREHQDRLDITIRCGSWDMLVCEEALSTLDKISKLHPNIDYIDSLIVGDNEYLFTKTEYWEHTNQIYLLMDEMNPEAAINKILTE